jgi:hypothetical protein
LQVLQLQPWLGVCALLCGADRCGCCDSVGRGLRWERWCAQLPGQRRFCCASQLPGLLAAGTASALHCCCRCWPDNSLTAVAVPCTALSRTEVLRHLAGRPNRSQLLHNHRLYKRLLAVHSRIHLLAQHSVRLTPATVHSQRTTVIQSKKICPEQHSTSPAVGVLREQLCAKRMCSAWAKGGQLVLLPPHEDGTS